MFIVWQKKLQDGADQGSLAFSKIHDTEISYTAAQKLGQLKCGFLGVNARLIRTKWLILSQVTEQWQQTHIGDNAVMVSQIVDEVCSWLMTFW